MLTNIKRRTTTETSHRQILIVAALAGALAFTTTSTQAEDINTRIGKLTFENGYPSRGSATKLYDEMDFQRATQAYLWSFPAVSCASSQASVFRDLGVTYNDLVVFDNFLDTKSVFLTGTTTTTTYAFALVDLVGRSHVAVLHHPTYDHPLLCSGGFADDEVRF